MTERDEFDRESTLPASPRIRWGQAWRDRLIELGWLDARRLGLGHGAVARTEVDTIEVASGRVTRVWNSPGTHEAVWIDIPILSEADWGMVAAIAAKKARHAGALLDGVIEASFIDDVRRAGIELLPSPDRLGPHCRCVEKDPFCSHAVTLMHAALHEINMHPFALMAFQGRTEAQFLAEMRRARRADSVEIQAAQPVQMDAATAWQRPLGDLPTSGRPVPKAPEPATWTSDSPDLSVEPAILRELAADAITRSWALARGDARSSLSLDLDADIARRAVDLLGTTRIVELAREMDEPAQRVIGLATAWREAGAGGLAMLSELPWRPDPEIVTEARELIAESGRRKSSVVEEMNTLTVANKMQFRYGRDQQWYRLDKRANHWMLLAAPASDFRDVLPPRVGAR